MDDIQARISNLSRTPFWRYRGVVAAANRYRAKHGRPGSRAYDQQRRSHMEFPDRKRVRALFGTGRPLDSLPSHVPPLDWSADEDAYLAAYYGRTPIRTLAARLGRSVRAVRRAITARGVDRAANIAPWSVVDHIFQLRPGTARRVSFFSHHHFQPNGMNPEQVGELAEIMDILRPGWRTSVEEWADGE